MYFKHVDPDSIDYFSKQAGEKSGEENLDPNVKPGRQFPWGNSGINPESTQDPSTIENTRNPRNVPNSAFEQYGAGSHQSGTTKRENLESNNRGTAKNRQSSTNSRRATPADKPHVKPRRNQQSDSDSDGNKRRRVVAEHEDAIERPAQSDARRRPRAAGVLRNDAAGAAGAAAASAAGLAQAAARRQQEVRAPRIPHAYQFLYGGFCMGAQGA
jgi:hypothetical protein